MTEAVPAETLLFCHQPQLDCGRSDELSIHTPLCACDLIPSEKERISPEAAKNAITCRCIRVLEDVLILASWLVGRYQNHPLGAGNARIRVRDKDSSVRRSIPHLPYNLETPFRLGTVMKF